jgi:hypothetical protein
MKKWLIGIVLGIGIIGASVYDNTYILKDCIVAEVCEQSALIQDYNGNLWEVHSVDLQECDIVNLIMDNNGTKDIEDDIVKHIK